MRELVGSALVNKGVSLGALKRTEEEFAAYDDVIERLGDATELGLRERTARALVNKGMRLGQLNRSKEAIAAYWEVERRFGKATEPTLREEVAKAQKALQPKPSAQRVKRH